ncbi:MAG: FAD-binding oxidoreductase [Acidimicrobiia bacterium]
MTTAAGPGVPGGFLHEVTSVLGPGHVVLDPDLLAGYATDWTRRWTGDPAAALRPSSPEELAEVVRAARRHRVALVPQGGNSGLAGGATPLRGEVVVDMRRFTRLDPVDELAGQVTVGAAITPARLDAHLAGSGLAFGVDLGARDVATIGGMVATNAGGVHVIRHGHMRAQVLGVQAVLGTGEVLEANLAGLHKDNTGLDLAGLLCGSEGTLGFVTAARLRLVARPEEVATALVGFASVDDAVAGAARLRHVEAVQAVELMVGAGLGLVADHLGRPFPLPGPPTAVLLVESAGRGALAELGAAVEGLPGGAEVAVGEDAGQRAGLWRWREGHPEAAAARGVVHKADVTLPARELAGFVDAVPGLVERAWPGATTLVYGHAGDGNVHVNVVGPPPEDHGVVDAVLEAVLARGGSVSAEHGIGTSKRDWLVRQRGEVAVAAMRAVKAALDPDGVCNPNALLPPASP